MIRANLFLLATYTIFVSMKTPVDIWVELDARLSSFGQDAASREVIVRACQKNDWFEPEEIVDAVRSIREEFLSRDKIEHWLACYERPATLPSRTVLVVMAGNIPLVGFFDLLCVVTAGHRCLVKMSSKDAMLMSFVIDQLKKIEPDIPVAVYNGATPFDAAIATGSDNANRYFRSLYAGVKTLLRGNRHSVAVLNGRETSGQLEALSDDIFSYSGGLVRQLVLVEEGWRVREELLDASHQHVHTKLVLSRYRENLGVGKQRVPAFHGVAERLLVALVNLVDEQQHGLQNANTPKL